MHKIALHLKNDNIQMFCFLLYCFKRTHMPLLSLALHLKHYLFVLYVTMTWLKGACLYGKEMYCAVFHSFPTMM